MPRDEQGGGEDELSGMNVDDALDGVTTADDIDADDGEVVDVTEVDMDAGDEMDLDPVVNSDGTIVARPVGLEALADPEDGKFACVVCDARSGGEQGAKVHFGRAGHAAADVENTVNHDSEDDGDGEEIVTPDETDDAEDWSNMNIDTTGDDDGDAGSGDDGETTWDDVRDAYSHARVQGSPVTRNDARDSVVAVLETETEWMSIDERSEPGKYDLWRWTDDGWQDDGYTHVETQMRTELGAIASDTEVGHIVAQLATLNYVKQKETNARHLDETFIPVGNGVINVDEIEYDADSMTIDWGTVTVQDMDPEHRFLYRVQADWDPETADLDGLDEWLETITRTDEGRRLIWEFAGHAVHPRYPADGFTVFNGRGDSGKSQTLEVIKAMLGGSNVAVETMQSIQTERFAGRRVVDKRANINTELEGTKMPSIGTLKTFSAGEEVSVEGKGTAAFDTLNDATMMFASDSPPAFPQSNRAVGRRVYPVEFPCIYTSDPDPDNPLELQSRPKIEVQAELQADARLKAALIRAVEGLVRILREGDFTSELTENERLEKYESFADPIRDSVRECVKPCSDGVIESGDLERTLGAYMDMAGHDGKKMQQIWNVMQEMTDIPVTKDRTRTFAPDKEKHTVYEGIEFTDAALEHCVPESAYWDEYTDEEDAEDDEFDRVTVKDIEARGTGRYDGVKVKAHSVRDEPAPWLNDQGVVADDTGSIRYESPEGIALNEGETYVLKNVIVTSDDADLKMQLIDGMTDVTELVTRDDEQDAAVEDEETGDSPEYLDDDMVGGDTMTSVKGIINELEGSAENGVPVQNVIDLARHDAGLDPGEVEHELAVLKHSGTVYEPKEGHLQTTSSGGGA